MDRVSHKEGTMLTPGEPAPWFRARNTKSPRFLFDTVAGRYIVLCFFGSAGDPASGRVVQLFEQSHDRFDLQNCSFLGVSTDPADEFLSRIRQQWPAMSYFWDFDGQISRRYGIDAPDGSGYERQTLVLDQSLRVLAVFPFEHTPEIHVGTVLQYVQALPPVRSLQGRAPVLVVSRVFDHDFCRALIAFYEEQGGAETGYMREIDGQTVHVVNHNFKRRSDCILTDPELLQNVESRLRRCVIPEVKKAFQFDATHIERYNVAYYDAAVQGFFHKHRDDSANVTAHRRFAVTINLNAEDYDGGDLAFPEFGPATYRAPTGGAIVFSCTLMHEVTPMTRGKRYAILPFLYDDAAERIREANLAFLDAGTV
jgi:peroxiredoxin